MAVSKINQTDAQEWLESLQQVGEGWYRGVALAVRVGAPKAMGLTDKEFAQAIGQKLIDPRPAIIELAAELKYRGKPNIQAIATVLSLNKARVAMILAEEGLIEPSPTIQEALETGMVPGGRQWAKRDQQEQASVTASASQEEVEALREQVAEMAAAVKGEKAKAAADKRALKAKNKELAAELYRVDRAAFEKAQESLTEQERERAAKEADAWAQEKAAAMLAGFAGMTVGHIVASLHEAADGVRELLSDTNAVGVSAEHISTIEEAHAAFIEEMNVARMSERSA